VDRENLDTGDTAVQETLTKTKRPTKPAGTTKSAGTTKAATTKKPTRTKAPSKTKATASGATKSETVTTETTNESITTETTSETETTESKTAAPSETGTLTVHEDVDNSGNKDATDDAVGDRDTDDNKGRDEDNTNDDGVTVKIARTNKTDTSNQDYDDDVDESIFDPPDGPAVPLSPAHLPALPPKTQPPHFAPAKQTGTWLDHYTDKQLGYMTLTTLVVLIFCCLSFCFCRRTETNSRGNYRAIASRISEDAFDDDYSVGENEDYLSDEDYEMHGWSNKRAIEMKKVGLNGGGGRLSLHEMNG
jgi:hypothetical protein